MFKDLVNKKGKEDKFFIDSAATSTEEIGNPIYPPARRLLASLGIDTSHNRAKQIDYKMYQDFDFIIVMEERNRYGITSRLGSKYESKIHLLLEYAGISRGIADPWYTGDFDQTYQDLKLGLNAFYDYLENNNLIGD